MLKDKNWKFAHFENIILVLLVFALFLLTTSTNAKKSSFPGHLEKLGSHNEGLGVTIIGKWSTPYVLYHHFVDPGKPLMLKGVLEHVDHPGLTTWTDEYLKNNFGSQKVRVEKSKIEDRENDHASLISLKQFLQLYKKEDVYLVHSLNNGMKDLALIPETFHCGGFQNVIQDSVMWLGSGKISSVLHRDSLDNILCLLDGEKDIVLIDKAYKEMVENDGFEQAGGYSRVDPLAVDMETFPHFRNLIWHEVKLRKGDCVFIPQYWYHQVNSQGSRHLSVNIWFSHLCWFNSMNCSITKDFYKPLEPVSTFGFASPNEVHRSNLLKRFQKKGFLTEERFHELLPNNPTRERSNQFFQRINEFIDPVLSWGELYSFDIDKVLMEFSDLFDLTGEPYHESSEDEGKDSEYSQGDEIIDNEDEDTESKSSQGDENNLCEKEVSVSEDEIQMASHDQDNCVPLPDALSVNDILLPDDPIGSNLRNGGDDANVVDQGVKEESHQIQKDEL